MNDHLNGDTPKFSSEYRIRHKKGHWIWVAARGRTVALDGDGAPTRVVGTLHDITERKEKEIALTTVANTDFLTGTASRRHFLDFSEHEFARSLRNQSALSLMALDLDFFKRVNDAHGHAGGDHLLRSFVHTVGSLLRMTDVFGRVGGEEFCVLLPETDLKGARVLAERILKVVRATPAQLEAGPVKYSVSIGVSQRDPKGTTFTVLMDAADKALYKAKRAGRDRVAVAS